MDIFGFIDGSQLKSPFLKTPFVIFLGALREVLFVFLKFRRDELFGEFVPPVQPFSRPHGFPIAILSLEGLADYLGLLSHKLLSGGATAGFGVSLSMDLSEKRSPIAALPLRVVDG